MMQPTDGQAPVREVTPAPRGGTTELTHGPATPGELIDLTALVRTGP
jgi:hypothetical protein